MGRFNENLMADISKSDVLKLALQVKNGLGDDRYQQICEVVDTMSEMDLAKLHELLVSVQNDFSSAQKKAYETLDIARGTLNGAKTAHFLEQLHARENDERTQDFAAGDAALQALIQDHG